MGDALTGCGLAFMLARIEMLKNNIKLKIFLFQSFDVECFIRWFYDNESLIESEYSGFYEAILEESEMFLFNEIKVINLIKEHLVDNDILEWWKLEFYCSQILEPERSLEYCRNIYFDYYEDRGIQFLYSLSDLIVLYSFDKLNLDLPPLSNLSRATVNSTIVYPKITNEINKIFNLLTETTIDENEKIWIKKNGLYNTDNFQITLKWYKNEIEKVANIS
ncbi:hypothetical protein [Flammeovirga aprica]|uniref:Uncharacterized protein n=1 Tax=Flammeovirga aprica JL-4 TaxID=694437 RepID=A0A7X9XDJ0_9BACT|nr:hypothetical protein [Flammeovirga aprica]NME72689.1 hypothetical protein [Flammeovirga aprica JL-4]